MENGSTYQGIIERNTGVFDAKCLAERLIENGYTPVPIRYGEKGPRATGWRQHRFEPSAFPQKANVGLRCGDANLAFFDIDIYDAAIVHAVREEWLKRFQDRGQWMQRTGYFPKAGMPFVTDISTPKLKQPVRPTGFAPLDEYGKPKTEAIEILADGQQFVAYGLHPDTQAPYYWDALDPADACLGHLKDLPLVTVEEVKAFLAWVGESFGPNDAPAPLSRQAMVPIVKVLPRPASTMGASVIEHFNRTHVLVDLLIKYGYQHRYGNHWTSPNSKTGSANVQVLGKRWRSLSGSDEVLGIGAKSQSGNSQTGDAFDLFVHYEFGGHFEEAIAAHSRATDLSARPERKSNLTSTETSDDALALELGARDFDENAKFVSEWGEWLFWDGFCWKQEHMGAVARVRDFLRAKKSELGKGDSLLSKNRIFAVESLARSNQASRAAAGDFDKETMLLGTPNGTVDLRTGQLRPARREDMISKLTTVGPEPGIPHRWLQFLQEIKVDPEFLQRLAGYCLTGSTKEEKLLFFYSAGTNGKTKFVEQLVGILGDKYSRKAAVATLMEKTFGEHPTELAGLAGARLVTASEIPPGKRWNEAIIKDLTGGDTITARFMRQDFFDFRPQLTLIVFGNTQPSLSSVDNAIRRRMVLVPFLASFKDNPDLSLSEKLEAEWPQILSWAIEGAVKWYQDGLKIPAAILEASNLYLEAEDLIGNFLEDRCVDEPGGYTSIAKLYEVFVEWCKYEGHPQWSRKAFAKAVVEKGYQEVRRSFGKVVNGLTLKPIAQSTF